MIREAYCDNHFHMQLFIFSKAGCDYGLVGPRQGTPSILATHYDTTEIPFSRPKSFYNPQNKNGGDLHGNNTVANEGSNAKCALSVVFKQLSELERQAL